MKPLAYFWDGHAMVPLLRFTKDAQRQFTVGDQYKMRAEHDRSVASHNSYFAEIDTLWRKLGDYKAFPTSEHLRRYALIMTGYYDERKQGFHDVDDADNAAKFICRYLKYEQIEVEYNDDRQWYVIVRTPQSQSRGEMGEKDFKESKKQVLKFIEDVVKNATTDQSGRRRTIYYDGPDGGPR